MEVIGGAWQTDLALHELSGATVEHRPTYAVSRPGPGGATQGLLLLRRTPMARDVPLVVKLLRTTFPEAPVVRLGIDDPDGTASDLRAFVDHGFEVTAASVLTAATVTATAQLPVGTTTEVRAIEDNADWAARQVLRMAAHGETEPVARERVAAERDLAHTGKAAWYGAYQGERLLAGCGVVVPAAGIARLQDVDTRPGARHEGLTPMLVEAAGRHALDRLGATSLMVVADPGHPSIGRYEGLGFRASGTQLRAWAPTERLRG